ncbi:fimbrial protein [Pseudomonas fragi]|uniref:fimbrial protein n=1 Tax=Pseudomonas TaxID=286 RepID=UPI0021C163F2|nr:MULTISPECIES: fimbrial protein [Pseudomonas]UXL37119.1 fimbrial protein [Pseudomonas fragi]
MRLKQQSVLFAVCAIGFGGNAMANLTFEGTLIEPPPCTINSGASIVIDFEKIGVRTIDGVNHRKPVNYTITCSPGTQAWEMVLKVTGTATPFESSAVQSSVTDLGVRLLKDGVPLALNTQVLINPAEPPMLEAVPVKKLGSSLSLGGFTAMATLLADYQ